MTEPQREWQQRHGPRFGVYRDDAYENCVDMARLYTSGRADLHTLSPEVWAYLVRGLLRELDKWNDADF